MANDLKKPQDQVGVRLPAWVWVGFILALAFVCVVRFRLRDLPLERDEGEYAYIGRSMLEGVPPFKLAYSMKLPGTSAIYALIMTIFGQTPAGIHLGLLVVNLATIWLVYLLGRKLIDSFSGVIAAVCYALLSLHPSVMGLAAHATNFVIVFALAGVLVLLRAVERGGMPAYFFSGILLGLGFVMKQPGLLFVLFGLLFLLRVEWKREPFNKQIFALRIAGFSAGAALPFALVCLWMWRAGVFQQFWFWAFTYATTYGSRLSLGDGWRMLEFHVGNEMGMDLLFWLLGAVGAVFLWRDKSKRALAVFLTAFLFVSLIAAGQGLYFRPHYFILTLPALCLLIGAGFDSVSRWNVEQKFMDNRRFAPAGILAAASAILVLSQGQLFFRDSPAQASEHLYTQYGPNPFPVSAEIARFVREHTAEGDSIAVLGSEPQIYFYSGRKSATGYLYTYSLMEPGPLAAAMQKGMMSEIEAAQPEVIVMMRLQFSWGVTAQSDRSILAWAQKYCADNYEAAGVIELPVKSDADFHTGADAERHLADPGANIRIFKRKRHAPAGS